MRRPVVAAVLAQVRHAPADEDVVLHDADLAVAVPPEYAARGPPVHAEPGAADRLEQDVLTRRQQAGYHAHAARRQQAGQRVQARLLLLRRAGALDAHVHAVEEEGQVVVRPWRRRQLAVGGLDELDVAKPSVGGPLPPQPGAAGRVVVDGEPAAGVAVRQVQAHDARPAAQVGRPPRRGRVSSDAVEAVQQVEQADVLAGVEAPGDPLARSLAEFMSPACGLM